MVCRERSAINSIRARKNCMPDERALLHEVVKTCDTKLVQEATGHALFCNKDLKSAKTAPEWQARFRKHTCSGRGCKLHTYQAKITISKESSSRDFMCFYEDRLIRWKLALCDALFSCTIAQKSLGQTQRNKKSVVWFIRTRRPCCWG